MSHPLFEDYLAKQREDSVDHSDPYKSNRLRDKSKVFFIPLKPNFQLNLPFCFVLVIKYIITNDR